MARQADQKMRFNDAELSLMKNTFADNDDLLFAIRKVMLGVKLEAHEQVIVKASIVGPVYDVVHKLFFPTLDADAPLFQLTDMFMTLANDMRTLGVESMTPLIQAKQIEIDYLEQQLAVLKDVEHEQSAPIKLSELIQIQGKSSEEAFIEITARNYLLSWIDSNLQQVKFLAGKKEETVEETKERLQKDSAK